jgi:hypothetical protein
MRGPLNPLMKQALRKKQDLGEKLVMKKVTGEVRVRMSDRGYVHSIRCRRQIARNAAGSWHLLGPPIPRKNDMKRPSLWITGMSGMRI